MVAPAALLSSENQSWCTPEWFLDLVRRVGDIVLDPCTTSDNPTKAAWICTGGANDNGLVCSWEVDGLVYVNPPYGEHLRGDIDPDKQIVRRRTNKKTGEKVEVLVGVGTGWARKMANHTGEGLYLVPARVETDWWKMLNDWCTFKLQWSSPQHGARINFVDPNPDNTKKNGSTFPSTVFYRGSSDGVTRFIQTFGPHGTLEPGARTFREMLEHAWKAGWRP